MSLQKEKDKKQPNAIKTGINNGNEVDLEWQRLLESHSLGHMCCMSMASIVGSLEYIADEAEFQQATRLLVLCFQSKLMLAEFDLQNGLLKLYKAISNLSPLIEENRQQYYKYADVLRHLCFTLKCYMESHLFYKLIDNNSTEFSKASNMTREELSSKIAILQEDTTVRDYWTPVDQLVELGGITMLLKILSLYSLDYSTSKNISCSVLDVLSICCVIPRVSTILCKRHISESGLCTVLRALADHIDEEDEVLKSGLAVICHCICWFINVKEVPIEDVCETIRRVNGILALVSFLQIKNTTTDAYYIRGMTCRALAGLAQSERVRQILSELEPIKELKNELVLQEQCDKYLLFRKYAFALLECIFNESHSKPYQLSSNTLTNSALPSLATSSNMCLRVFSAQTDSKSDFRRFDCRYVHEHIAPCYTIRPKRGTTFTSCNIVQSSNLLLVGTECAIKAFNLKNGTEKFSANTPMTLNDLEDDISVDRLLSNRAGDMALSISNIFQKSVLWSIRDNELVQMLTMADDFGCDFSNTTPFYILAYHNVHDDMCVKTTAVIYDIETGLKTSTFTPTMSDSHSPDNITFNATDDQILCHNTLFDARSGEVIHEFDKLSGKFWGFFHPNRVEIVSINAIWDVRTFRLLRHVPALEASELRFSPLHVVYAMYENKLKLVDAYDYSHIGTIDVKYDIINVSINKYGNLLALNGFDHTSSYVRVYAVGTKEKEQEEENKMYPIDDDTDSDFSD